MESVDAEVLETLSRWWGGRAVHEFDGSWQCDGLGGYDLLIEPAEGQLTVWCGILQDNVEGIGPVVRADPDIALKCLLARVGPRFRDREGLDRLLIPFSAERARPGFTILGPFGSEVEWWADGKHQRISLGRGRATEFTYYGRASLDQVIASFESVDGAPLFADVERIPAGDPRKARP